MSNVGVIKKERDAREITKNTYSNNLVKCIKKNKTLYILLIPVLLYFLVVKYLPMLGTLMAFQDFKFSTGILGSKWVGMAHFNRLFHSADFYKIFANTVLLNIYGIIFGFPIPIILALMLNEIKSLAFKKMIQSVLYVPCFISWVVLGGICNW